jgi:hypothetical protein
LSEGFLQIEEEEEKKNTLAWDSEAVAVFLSCCCLVAQVLT